MTQPRQFQRHVQRTHESNEYIYICNVGRVGWGGSRKSDQWKWRKTISQKINIRRHSQCGLHRVTIYTVHMYLWILFLNHYLCTSQCQRSMLATILVTVGSNISLSVLVLAHMNDSDWLYLFVISPRSIVFLDYTQWCLAEIYIY